MLILIKGNIEVAKLVRLVLICPHFTNETMVNFIKRDVVSTNSILLHKDYEFNTFINKVTKEDSKSESVLDKKFWFYKGRNFNKPYKEYNSDRTKYRLALFKPTVNSFAETIRDGINRVTHEYFWLSTLLNNMSNNKDYIIYGVESEDEVNFIINNTSHDTVFIEDVDKSSNKLVNANTLTILLHSYQGFDKLINEIRQFKPLLEK